MGETNVFPMRKRLRRSDETEASKTKPTESTLKNGAFPLGVRLVADEQQMSNSNGDFLSLAVGYAVVVRISTVSAQAALCAALGYFVDRRFETAPWGTVVGALLGAAALGVGIVATVKRLEREDATAPEEMRNGRNRDKVDFDAALSEESLKTEALRGEFEETLERATAFFAEKTEKTAISLGGDETARLR
jgi:F0F1-type ATP synthase assembly protein I